MGWEWRIFHKELFDVWKLLGQTPSSLGFVEQRTDLYVLSTNALSIKFRYGEHLEFKIREKRDESGAELWRKEEFHDVSMQKNPNIKALQSLVSDKLLSLASKYAKDLQPLITRAAQQVREDDWKSVEVSKRRQNSYYGGVHIEQTNITLIGKDEQWKTVCVEGSLENIQKFFVSSHGKQIIELGYKVQGYPEFLCTTKSTTK